MCGHTSGRASRCQREGRGSTPFATPIMTDLLNKKCVPCEDC